MQPRREPPDLHDVVPPTFVCPDCGSVRPPRVVHHPAGTVLLCQSCRAAHRAEAVAAVQALATGGVGGGTAADSLVAAG